MATIVLSAYFTYDGEPKTGLSCTVRIRDLSDNSLVITDANMTGVGDGWYKYSFTSYDSTKDYVARAYGGTGTQPAGEKYAPITFPTSGLNNISVDDILNGIIEGTLTVKEVLAVSLAKAAGTGVGGGTNTLQYNNQAGDTVRITYAVLNNYGDRTTTIDVSDL